MVILTVHNSYREPGGEDVVFEAESRMLERCGHTVHRYIEDNKSISRMALIRVGFEAIWSDRSYRTIARLLRETRFDVVHCHNTFPLISPSVYYAAKEANVPVVQSLHNYRLLCSNAILFRGGKVCEECIGSQTAWRGIAHGCFHHSRIATGTVAAMQAVHRALGTWENMVDLYIAPSSFCREKYVQAGFAAERITVKPGFVYPDPGVGDQSGNFCLFAGRLSTEKGIDLLLNAFRQLGPQFPLKVIGDGPLSGLVAAAARDFPHIQWLGQKSQAEVFRLMGMARLVIVPSAWYETFGLVVVEAFASGTPVIVSNIGALAELVHHGHNGFHFDPSSVDALVRTVELAFSGSDKLLQMGRNARADYLRNYSEQTNLESLLGIYQGVTGCERNVTIMDAVKS